MKVTSPLSTVKSNFWKTFSFLGDQLLSSALLYCPALLMRQTKRILKIHTVLYRSASQAVLQLCKIWNYKETLNSKSYYQCLFRTRMFKGDYYLKMWLKMLTAGQRKKLGLEKGEVKQGKNKHKWNSTLHLMTFPLFCMEYGYQKTGTLLGQAVSLGTKRDPHSHQWLPSGSSWNYAARSPPSAVKGRSDFAFLSQWEHP